MLHRKLIDKYKSFRKHSYLNNLGKYRFQYAFVGVGNHSISNLYPCLESLRVPLKFILSRNLSNAQKFSQRFPGCQATADLDDIVGDKNIGGVFICSHPSRHFCVALEALQAGKNVFVEKPPCYTSSELKELIAAQGKSICMIALQRRFSTVNRLIKRHRLINKAESYSYRYCTGPYPEGDPITELFIHPVDNVIQLFGEITELTVKKIKHTNGISFHLLTTHTRNVRGMIELSTGYSWNEAFEVLEVNTSEQTVYASYPNELRTVEKAGAIFQIPKEKMLSVPPVQKMYFNNKGFIPGVDTNSLVVHGFYPEVKHFLRLVESAKNDQYGNIASLSACYAIMDQLALAE